MNRSQEASVWRVSYAVLLLWNRWFMVDVSHQSISHLLNNIISMSLAFNIDYRTVPFNS